MATAHERANAAWDDVEPTPVIWHSDDWAVEVRGDELAHLTFRGAVVLRSIRAVVRDRDWNTVPVTVVEMHDGHDVLELDLAFAGYGADLRGSLRIAVDGGHFSVDFDADNRRDFERCRIGLVVLHGPDSAGTPLEVEHPDGSVSATAFPRAVSPHQPVLEIARLAWSVDGVRIDARFEGDVFEMEDQRNWTDASFKTYSTPLSVPFPVLVTAGTHLHQAVHLVGSGEPRPAEAVHGMRLVATAAVVPEIVLGAATGPTVHALDGLPPRRLVELDLRDANWRAALQRARDEVPNGMLDVRLVASDPGVVGEALDVLAGYPLVRLGAFSPESHVTEPDLWEALRDGASRRGVVADLVGGARTHYTELNRTIDRLPADIPALAFSVTPQMHARERAQVVESIPMIRRVAEDAVEKAAGRPVHVGPITLRPRVNAVATVPARPDERTHVDGGYGPEKVDGSTDPRQASTAVAAWAVSAVAAAAVPGIASITLFESSGARGLVDVEHPEGMPALAAVRALTPLAGLPLMRVAHAPAGLAILGAREGRMVRVLAANLTSDRIEVDAELEADGASGRLTIGVDAWSWREFRAPLA